MTPGIGNTSSPDPGLAALASGEFIDSGQTGP
jgi:hypothetical protein